MNDDPRTTQIITALDEALVNTLSLQRRDDIKDFFAPDRGPPRFLREHALRMARHFDLAPAFLVLDPTLGSLGIVEVALPSNPQKLAAEAVVQRHIDTATYARHLLLRDKDLKDRKALSVELVLLTANETAAEQKFYGQIGNALRKTLRDSDSLYHIGVGILRYQKGVQPYADRLRRAFPWLLKATRQWLESADAKAPEVAEVLPQAANAAAAVSTQPSATAAPRQLRSVSLTNYRLPGTRTLELADTSVHLIHGPNGSGKSSIVEAFELVSTGKVDRLEQAQVKTYDAVIRNHEINQAATIKIQWKDNAGPPEPLSPRTVMPDGLPDPIAPGIEASSFRLDQPLMSKLIGQYPHARAEEFMRVFFPEAKESLVEYRRTARTREESRPPLASLRKKLSDARAALEEHSNWTRTASPSGAKIQDYPDLLNCWLERTALLDLLQKHRAVRETIQGAEHAHWRPHELTVTDWLAALGPVADLEILARYEKSVRAEINELQAALDEFKASKAPQGTASAAAKVTAEQAKALNEASKWLFAEDVHKSFGLFGDKVVRVVNGGDAPTYGTVIIGATEWCVPVIAQIDALIDACKKVETDNKAPAWPGQNPPSEYTNALEAQSAALVAGRQISERFIDRLRPRRGKSEFDGSLIAAVNELMALFTPARWSYEDIDLPTTSGDGKVGLNLTLGTGEQPMRAELHLNTAELNLFTVALFMLCATRVRKPLNLLLFDDPLQNMDELTSTSLARGLTKVVRLWAELGRTERLLLLFHGNEDIERFSKEIAAAVYRLPWLSPSAHSKTDPIVATNHIGKIDVQHINHLFDKRPTT